MPSADVCAEQRHHRVETQIVARGIRDPAVLAVMRTVPREVFVPPEVVTASAPAIPEALLAQLAVGGRLVMPVGAPPQPQQLIRVTRESATTFRREDVGWVRCGPLSAADEGANRHHSRGGQRTSPRDCVGGGAPA